jgi:hypothetical protein
MAQGGAQPEFRRAFAPQNGLQFAIEFLGKPQQYRLVELFLAGEMMQHSGIADATGDRDAIQRGAAEAEFGKLALCLVEKEPARRFAPLPERGREFEPFGHSLKLPTNWSVGQGAVLEEFQLSQSSSRVRAVGCEQ